jgi:hypothetical protein
VEFEATRNLVQLLVDHITEVGSGTNVSPTAAMVVLGVNLIPPFPTSMTWLFAALTPRAIKLATSTLENILVYLTRVLHLRVLGVVVVYILKAEIEKKFEVQVEEGANDN